MSVAPPAVPLRIVSLVPSQTELLFDLGLTDEVVGLTRFCVHPAGKVMGKPIIGGTKNVQISRVAALQPTLILANDEENTQVDVEALSAIAPVHITAIQSLPDALAMIREVGTLVGRADGADTLARQIGESFAALRPRPESERPSVAYLIWRNPWMVAARDTFIDAMLAEAGFRNAFAGARRYPAVTETELRLAAPDLIFLSSEPFPFRQKQQAELAITFPTARVCLVDGELFSWYGSRLLQSAAYFARLRSNLIR